MNIAKGCAVSLDYTIKDDAGSIVDTTDGVAPLEYIHGRDELIAGLEKVLEGKEPGAQLKDIVIQPAEAFGEYLPQLVAEVERSSFPDDAEIEIDMQFEAEGPDGARIVTVTKVDGDKITVDGNHPLAGKTLRFDVKVLAVREATEEEKAYGLAHSCGCGCSHDSGACEDSGCDGGCCCGHGHGHTGC